MLFPQQKQKDETKDCCKVSVLYQLKIELVHRDLLKMISELQPSFLNFTPVLRRLVIKVTDNTLTQKNLLPLNN